LKSIKSFSFYSNFDKYKKTVLELNKVLSLAFDNSNCKVSLSDFEDYSLTMTNSQSLIKIFNKPYLNPFYNFYSKKIEKAINLQSPDIIGISLNYLSQASCTFSLAGFVRANFPNITIVIGGGLCSSWLQFDAFRNLCNSLGIKAVKGAGEKVLASLCGVNKVLSNEFIPDYSFVDYEKYFSPLKVLPFMAEKGCYYKKCRFCPERAENNKFEAMQVEKVFKRLAVQIEKVKPGLIHFIDNAISPKVLKYMSDNIKISWYGFVRVTKELEDLEFCKKLKKSGCVMLQLGIESGSDKVLADMEKGTTVASISKVLKNLKNVGIGVYAYFLFGTVTENEQYANDTYVFLKEHIDYIDFLNIAIFNLPVMSPDSDILKTKEFYDGDLSLYRDFKHPLNWNRKQVREFVTKKIKKDKDISKVINNTPPFFTSNHAPFFLMKDFNI